MALVNTASLLNRALDLARQGILVFPLNVKKRPMAGSEGFYDARTDPAVIRRAFADSLAQLIGVPTGSAAGIDVLDVDLDHHV